MLLSEEIHSGGLIVLLTLIDTMCCVDSYQYQVPHEILCMHYLIQFFQHHAAGEIIIHSS